MFELPLLKTDALGMTHWDIWRHSLSPRGGMMLSEQIGAQNFRLRVSAMGYESGWHTAGDPTLLVLLSGMLEIELRSGELRVFRTGDAFVAADDLPDGALHDPDATGHRARVIGETDVRMLHLKLGAGLL